MAIEVRCRCGARYNANPELAGRQVLCPACHQTLNVPGGAGSAVSPLDTAQKGAIVGCVCGSRFRAAASLAGMQVQCPNCGRTLTIPASKATPADGFSPLSGSDIWGAATAVSQPAPLQPALISRPASRARRRKTIAINPKLVATLVGGVAGLTLLIAGGIWGYRTVSSLVRRTTTSQETPAVPGAQPPMPERADEAAGNPATPATKWTEHVSASDGYRISLPSGYRVREGREPSPAGMLLTTVAQARTPDLGGFGVTCTTIPPLPANSPVSYESIFDGMFSASADQLIRTLKAEQLARNKIASDGHTAWELHLRGNENGRPTDGRLRLYLRDRRIYNVVWMGPTSATEDVAIRRFFDSFQLREISP